jgi:hypothetical protein
MIERDRQNGRRPWRKVREEQRASSPALSPLGLFGPTTPEPDSRFDRSALPKRASTEVQIGGTEWRGCGRTNDEWTTTSGHFSLS